MAQPIVAPSTSPEQAAAIMGSNFIGVEALEHHFGVKLTEASREGLFGRVPYSGELLRQCADTHILVARGALSLMGVWQAQPKLLCGGSNPWYEEQHFATTMVEAGWDLVRKSTIPGSINMTWDEQCALLGPNEIVPSAAALAQVILLAYLETGERLFRRVYVRTSNVTDDGIRVNVGSFEPNSLYVFPSGDSHQSVYVGLASCQKPRLGS